MREVIKEGRNVEEAIELACRELGVERDAIKFEIINLQKRGFLGLRNTPAKVRVTVEEPEPVEQPVKAQPRQAPQAQQPREEKPKAAPRPEPQKPAAPQKPRVETPEAKVERDEKPEKPERREPVGQTERKVKEEPRREQTDLVFVPSAQVEGKARTAADYVKSVLAEMGVTPEITVARTENGIILRLSGEGLGVIIGRRGETLDSLQYLSGLVANREEGDYMRVTIDSGNYRQKRERTLEQLAQKLSASAIRYGRPSTLEPMNPYERRIIHSTVSGIEGVSSSSVGEEPNRRVVITPDVLKPQSGRGRGPRPAGGGRPPRSGRPAGPRPEGGPRSEGGPRPFQRDDRGGRPPRRDRPMGPRPENVKPTPTSVDREYMKEIEREAPAFAKPEGEKPAVEKTTPARAQTPKEGDDLPLYGKIEL